MSGYGKVFAVCALLALGLGTRAWAGEPLPASLFIGDSQSCQTFGRVMDDKLREATKDHVYTRAMWGSSPGSWYDGSSTTDGFFEHDPEKDAVRGKIVAIPNFPQLLADSAAKLVVVELGSNLDWAIDQPDYIHKTIGMMIDDIKAKGARCAWIGPAASRARPRFEQLNDIVAAAVGGRCMYFDSIPFTPYPPTGGDGLHFDSLGARGLLVGHVWAEAAYDRIQECMKQVTSGRAPSAECAGL